MKGKIEVAPRVTHWSEPRGWGFRSKGEYPRSGPRHSQSPTRAVVPITRDLSSLTEKLVRRTTDARPFEARVRSEATTRVVAAPRLLDTLLSFNTLAAAPLIPYECARPPQLPA